MSLGHGAGFATNPHKPVPISSAAIKFLSHSELPVWLVQPHHKRFIYSLF